MPRGDAVPLAQLGRIEGGGQEEFESALMNLFEPGGDGGQGSADLHDHVESVGDEHGGDEHGDRAIPVGQGEGGGMEGEERDATQEEGPVQGGDRGNAPDVLEVIGIASAGRVFLTSAAVRRLG